ncbi:MAG: hypothetical protein JNN30_13165 [Rhodanobacteraceae bacterium]|nr:hypothetical protein [Rhodanobacteraceae bacterium]
MAWWNDIRNMLKQELGATAAAGADLPEPSEPLRQAQRLLQRTARELAQARARADEVRRRLVRAQARLEALTRAPQSHPRYRERLIELARAIARDTDLAGSFQAHLSQLDLLHDQVNRQLRELDHDVSMARTASVIGQATQAVVQAAPRRATAAKRVPAAGPKTTARTSPRTTAGQSPVKPVFRRARAPRVIETLQQLPRQRPGPDAHED